MKHRVMVNYDERFDVLYVGIGDKTNSYGDDSQDDILVMRDFDTDEITGFTIFGFMKKLKENSLPTIPKETNVSFNRDIIPQVENRLIS